ncbi:DUF6686 family protein [Mucilaginibacter jinjuensis]|uniref:Uncharacterized protein n=1 Tax=Mucilaginibacter jinjuensis TaxID=1176721 RepID=A0ABY7T1M5_9SPHI|nr:DUF6686 family protein [Mucilaginibacter jinjuensis]WCT10226.1 hypothetical protein PQO05_15935 [Mucilaginibacter jinjuensis]
MCETRVLAQSGTAVICDCPECGMMSIWHQNLMLSFTPDQMAAFHQFTSELNFDDRSFPFPDGSERAVVCTPNQDINFVFTKTEWRDLNVAMGEALQMYEVYKLLYSR